MLENAIAIEKVAEMKPNSVAVQRRQLNVNQKHDNIHRDKNDSMKLIVTVVPESGSSTNGRIDNDFAEIDGILNHIGLKADGKVVF